MIKVAVWDADTATGGELIRILLLHPEVELMTVASEANSGKTVQDIYYGLEGERTLRISNTIDFEDIDVLFTGENVAPGRIASIISKYPELKIIGFGGGILEAVEEKELVAPSLSEIYRKNLVRGARYSYLLTPVTSLTLISLFPLAIHLLLNSDLKIDIECPENLLTPDMAARDGRDICEILSSIQQSFNEKIHMDYRTSKSIRSMKVSSRLRCGISLEEIRGLYEGIYDDHNFTFMIDKKVDAKDVSGTQKCLINLSKPEENTLVVEAVADPAMRGGAGDAIHAMNLLLGLYEKIGLSFRAICQ